MKNIQKVKKWYNNYYQRAHIPSTKPWYEAAKKLLYQFPIEKKKNILEIGSGFGILLNQIEPEIMKIGIDLSFGAMQRALNKTKNLNTVFIVANGEALPLKDGIFDIIICCEVIEHLENDYKKLFKEILRTLKPDGYIILSFPNYINPFYLIVRILSNIFKQHRWINLQPIDKIYTYLEIKRIAKYFHLKIIEVIGKCYFIIRYFY